MGRRGLWEACSCLNPTPKKERNESSDLADFLFSPNRETGSGCSSDHSTRVHSWPSSAMSLYSNPSADLGWETQPNPRYFWVPHLSVLMNWLITCSHVMRHFLGQQRRIKDMNWWERKGLWDEGAIWPLSSPGRSERGGSPSWHHVTEAPDVAHQERRFSNKFLSVCLFCLWQLGHSLSKGCWRLYLHLMMLA